MCIYIYTHIHMYIYIHTYTHIVHDQFSHFQSAKNYKWRVSNPRTIAYAHFETPSESSKVRKRHLRTSR